MFGNNNWYLFIRLHDVLCERLQNIASQAQKLADEEARCKKERKESTAIALRLKAPSESRAISGGGVTAYLPATPASGLKRSLSACTRGIVCIMCPYTSFKL